MLSILLISAVYCESQHSYRTAYLGSKEAFTVAESFPLTRQCVNDNQQQSAAVAADC